MTDSNAPPPPFPIPQPGSAPTATATTTTMSNAPAPENDYAPLAKMPEPAPSAAEVPTDPFSDPAPAPSTSKFPTSPSGQASTGTSYSPPAGPPPPPATSSGSPLPQQSPQQPQPQQQPAQQNQAGDPRVASLKAMFPDYDDLILLSVLDSVNGNQEHAIDLLLGMSDPSYVGDPQSAQQQTQQPHVGSGPQPQPQPSQVGMTQEELDEQFARQLMLEEQQQQQHQWETQYQARQTRPQFAEPARPYQHGWQPQNTQGAQGGDTMADIQQSFNRIAETGKKTFGNIFSKVKAKIQEMDQPRPSQSAGQPPNVNPSTYSSAYQYGAGATADPWDPSRYENRVSANPPQVPPPTTRPQGFGSPSPPPSQPSSRVQGYDIGSESARQTTPTPSNPGTSTPPAAPASTTVGGASSPPRTGSGFGAAAGAPKTIDAGKLGLLPKKPVSLLRPEGSTPQQVQRQDSEDSDGLEYAESPFEDKRK